MTTLQALLSLRPDTKEEIKALTIKLGGIDGWKYVSAAPSLGTFSIVPALNTKVRR